MLAAVGTGSADADPEPLEDGVGLGVGLGIAEGVAAGVAVEDADADVNGLSEGAVVGSTPTTISPPASSLTCAVWTLVIADSLFVTIS